jgi:hypothetical protein
MNNIFLIFILSCLSLSHAFSQEGKGVVKSLSKTLSSIENNECVIDRTVATTKIKAISGKEFEVSSISYEYLDEIFDYLEAQEHIPFKYPEDGCYARAHEMSRLMKEKGIITGKTFIEGDLRVETPNSPKGYVEWWYHVAPIVVVNHPDGQEQVYVIDPSIFKKPVPVQEWYNIQTKHQNGRKDDSYYTPRFAYFPSHKNTQLEDYRVEDLEDAKRTMEDYLRIQKQRQANALTNSIEKKL